MNIDRIVILATRETQRGKLNGRSWKVLLNRLGLGRRYHQPKDINVFKAFLDNRQYTWGDHAETAVKFSFALQRINRVDDGQGNRSLCADLARRLSSKAGVRTIGTVSLNLKTRQIAYEVDPAVCEEEGLDYVELMGRSIEDYEKERVVRLSEIVTVAESLLRDIGFGVGPEWFIKHDEEKVATLRELAKRVYEWGYEFTVDEIDLNDLKKSSGKLAEIEQRAYDYVWGDVQRRFQRNKRVPQVFYRGMGFVVDKLVAENKIVVRKGNITVCPGSTDAAK